MVATVRCYPWCEPSTGCGYGGCPHRTKEQKDADRRLLWGTTPTKSRKMVVGDLDAETLFARLVGK